MSSRFNKNKKSFLSKTAPWLRLSMFVLLLAILFFSMNSISASTAENQKESLENAIIRSVTHCYATQGFYPDSLDYIKENYQISYDENRFAVMYSAYGANICPEITVLEIK